MNAKPSALRLPCNLCQFCNWYWLSVWAKLYSKCSEKYCFYTALLFLNSEWLFTFSSWTSPFSHECPPSCLPLGTFLLGRGYHCASLHITTLSLTREMGTIWFVSKNFPWESYSTHLFKYISSQGKFSVKFNAEAITWDLPLSFKLKISILALAKIKLSFSFFKNKYRPRENGSNICKWLY